MNNRAVSPLVATIFLVIFALIIGTATMNWGKSYVDKINREDQSSEQKHGAIIIGAEDIDTPLKELQIEHILGRLSEQDYLQKEKELIG